MCLSPLNGAPRINIDNFDKFVHALFHLVFTTLWFFYFRLKFKEKSIWKVFQIAFLLSVCAGIAIEFMQKYWTDNRSADLLDVVANMSGASLAFAFCYYLDRSKYVRNILKY